MVYILYYFLKEISELSERTNDRLCQLYLWNWWYCNWDGADTVSCVELPNLRLGNMKGAWTHGAMMTHIRTFVSYFSRLKSLVLPAVGSTKPILRPRIQKPQAMVKHWWNRMGVYLHWEQEAMVIDIFGFTREKTTHLFGYVKKSGQIEGSKFSMHLQRKGFVPDLKGSCKFNHVFPCFWWIWP